MRHYVDIKKKLIDKTNYAERVVKERNEAQDEIRELRVTLGLSDADDLVSYVKTLKESLDKKED